MFKITQEFLNKNFGWILRIGSFDYLMKEYLEENPPPSTPSHTIRGLFDISDNNVNYSTLYFLRTLDEKNQILDLYITASFQEGATFTENRIIDLSEIPGIYPMNNMGEFDFLGSGISDQENHVGIRYYFDGVGIGTNQMLVGEEDTGLMFANISVPISKDFVGRLI